MPEKRVVLRNCGFVNPADISSYVDRDGFKALEKALETMDQARVIEEVKASGLRGRGGAGFPCGLKWETARNAPGNNKYIICNADEGEMGTFKDRYLIENDPFSLIEGLAIACYAIGARQAFIYLREEYHFLVKVLKRAIEQTSAKAFSGDVKIAIVEGAGAYVCGEESALMESIEGRRGEARYRPPFPPIKGLFGKPTIINNVETLMNIPQIIMNGWKWFRSVGTDRSAGTKAFSVSGDVESPGVYELPLGSRLRELIIDLAAAKDIQAVQVGGAAGRLIPASMLDVELSYESVLGSGAVMVFNRSRDLIGLLHGIVQFFAEESCGKCVPCREGTQIMKEILERMMNAQGESGDLKVLEELSALMNLSSLCGLGQSVAMPVLDSLSYFRSKLENRIAQSALLRGLKGINQ
jgi:NADH:ubiquinone oxidoreductase subunit F (NADH-binding)